MLESGTAQFSRALVDTVQAQIECTTAELMVLERVNTLAAGEYSKLHDGVANVERFYRGYSAEGWDFVWRDGRQLFLLFRYSCRLTEGTSTFVLPFTPNFCSGANTPVPAPDRRVGCHRARTGKAGRTTAHDIKAAGIGVRGLNDGANAMKL